MKNMIKLTGISLLAATLLTGCCTNCSKPADGEGTSITLEDALASIGRGFYLMSTNEHGISTGLLPDTVAVTLNVSGARASANNISAGLTVSAPVAVGVNAGANLSGSHSSSQTSQTANTITITFKNIMFAGSATSSNSTLPLLRDPDTAIKMLTWINTNSFPMMTNADQHSGTRFYPMQTPAEEGPK